MDSIGRMIREQIVARGVTDPLVLDAMRSVPREEFVPAELRALAYDDGPLPIGNEQTISQPYIVALMTSLLRLRPEDRVLEVGTGCGYQSAILARLASVVYSAELDPKLARSARERLERLGITNVVVREGDGREVFRDRAPFDAILVAAAPLRIPEDLIDQLADGGRCAIPTGGFDAQTLWLIERDGERLKKRDVIGVRFVPMR
ncbi:MAG TPA: protein-L-isoaspartate(D-aspartate) O-methyltransferase [Thermoanaerobaculia bacterium]